MATSPSGPDKITIEPLNQSAPRASTLTVPVPASPSDISLLIEKIGSQSRVPFGVEVVDENTARDHRPLATSQLDNTVIRQYDMSRLSVTQILDTLGKFSIIGPYRTYIWSKKGEVYRIRPSQFLNNRGVALNRPISHMRIKSANAIEALFAVQRIFDPSYAPVSPTPPKHSTEVERRYLNKTVEVTIDQGVVSDVLDSLVTQCGGMSWFAEYSQVGGGYQGLKLSLTGFDGWRIVVAARPPKK